jgi:hypothetical protein
LIFAGWYFGIVSKKMRSLTIMGKSNNPCIKEEYISKSISGKIQRMAPHGRD